MLVVLAALICGLGSWVTARLYRHGRQRTDRHAVLWQLLTALVAGVSIWCTHFIAMLGYRAEVPVAFDLPLTVTSLIIANMGTAIGLILAARIRFRGAPLVGGAVVGLSIAAMHYAGMIAYRVQGAVQWDIGYLLVSILVAVSISALALRLGGRPGRWGEPLMAATLTVAIVALHFTGMTAFAVSPMDLPGDYVNPEALRVLALAVAGVATLIVLVGLFCHAIETRLRTASIAELTAARNAAESASRAKSEFMSVLSHELRTPLTVVMGYAAILARLKEAQISRANAAGGPIDLQAVRMGDQAELYGGKIMTAATHLLGLINEILDYSSLEFDDPKLQRESVPMRDLLEETAENFRDKAAERDATLHIDCDTTVAFADRARLSRILSNLVGNALRFSGSDDIILRVARAKRGFVLEVEDWGCGIPPEDHERIFQAFQQLELADNRKEGGTGLGLAICRKLAQAHGGEIAVQSTPGAGSLFTVTFPPEALDTAASDAALGRAALTGPLRPRLPRIDTWLKREQRTGTHGR
ncbi:ATP-binding protein [Frigidibacter sp. MR17.14]|uniref:sensor histidine kinase n=1 Tax=Frigidibacter sp. MR17.14 TaxID=3126509 RepID=UPI00301310BB